MRFVRATPNPAGALDVLYLLGEVPPPGTSDVEFDPPLAARGPARLRRLRILHFNDLHNHLQSLDPADRDGHVFSRIVRRYRDSRARAADDEIVLLVSGGDDHTGTPFDELLGWKAPELVMDPAYAAYSAAGVDVAALGNHDLDRGSAVLAAGIRQDAAFPILSANVRESAALVAGRDYFAAAFGVARGLRIGFIGLTTPVDVRLDTPSDPKLRVESPLATLERLLPLIAAAADIVVVMSHCGYGTDQPDVPARFGASWLAEGDVAIAGRAAALTQRPVVVVGAHTHTVLNADGFSAETLIGGVPIVQAGGQGSHLGEFEAQFATEATRSDWTIDARLFRLTSGPRDEAFERQVLAPMVARVQQRTDEILASVEWSDELSRETTLRQRYAGECALANFICDALVARSARFPGGPADVAMLNATAIGDGLPDHPSVSFRGWYRVQPFADTLQMAEMTGAQLLAVLRSNAQRILREEEMSGAGAIDPREFVSRGFLHFSGAVRYSLRLGRSASEATVCDATLNGQPLAALAARPLRVVFTNYVGAGGYGEAWNGEPIGAGVPGRLTGLDLRALPRRDSGLVFRNEVIGYVRGVGVVGPSTGARLDRRLAISAGM